MVVVVPFLAVGVVHATRRWRNDSAADILASTLVITLLVSMH